MSGGLSFTNLTKKRVNTAGFLRVYKKFLSGWDLSVVLAGAGLMRKLNKKYRKKDKTANVLSFLLEAAPVGRASPSKTGRGEIFLNANEKKLLYFFVHACLHLLGHNHRTKKEAEKMEKLEEKILNSNI